MGNQISRDLLVVHVLLTLQFVPINLGHPYVHDFESVIAIHIYTLHDTILLAKFSCYLRQENQEFRHWDQGILYIE